MAYTDAAIAGILYRFTSQQYSNARRRVQTGTPNSPELCHLWISIGVSGMMVVSNFLGAQRKNSFRKRDKVLVERKGETEALGTAWSAGLRRSTPVISDL